MPGAAELYARGQAQEKAGKLDWAAASFRAALAADPTYLDAELELGRCLARLGWRDEALDVLRDYLDSPAPRTEGRTLYDALDAQGDRIGAFAQAGDPPS